MAKRDRRNYPSTDPDYRRKYKKTHQSKEEQLGGRITRAYCLAGEVFRGVHAPT